ncbi:hypothetical protein SAMN05421823_10466 [Catalinimonas alkaloidigena]|uniref:Uncharacterized protein n=1 Tax=Catalinimonas alkaloidigena TaxID=1075417 RepID=A0A1G9GDS8_9BACT|nr:hypothetical protein [Catalinimonas alkaloidigena]SDK98433.1 hypothetical protein SAMN05421823_10466 [Catalinimonas alkaloidigena]
MFSLHTLEVVTGLIFIYLLLSLLATNLNEIITNALSLRGKTLHRAISVMLDDPGFSELSAAFYRLPLIKRFADRGDRGKPEYITKNNFSRALLHLLQEREPGKDLRKALQNLPDGETKQLLLSFYEEVQGDYDAFRASLEIWFDEMMDRTSGWYKRKVQVILFSIGMGIALVFNADTLQMTRTLSSDPEALRQIMIMAETFRQDPPPTLRKAAVDSTNLLVYQKAQELLHEQVEPVRNMLGMGWTAERWAFWQKGKIDKILLQLLGWMVTALAISLGAPFWFDLLKRIMTLRGSGTPPAEKRPPDVATPASPASRPKR